MYLLKGLGASHSLREGSGPKSKPEVWVGDKTSLNMWQSLWLQVMKLQEKAIFDKHQITWVFNRDKLTWSKIYPSAT